MKRWRLTLVAGTVVLVAVAATLAVAKAGATADPQRGASSSACAKLMNDPTATQAMQQLHEQHATEMQAWRDKYGSDPTAPEARQVLADLRKEHVADMRALFDKLGIKAPAGLCGAGMMGGSGSSMMGGSGSSMMGGSTTGSSVHEQHHSGQTGTTTPDGIMGGDSSGMMGGSSL